MSEAVTYETQTDNTVTLDGLDVVEVDFKEKTDSTFEYERFADNHSDTSRESNSDFLERKESDPGVPRPNVIWKPDNSTEECSDCNRFFTFFLRRHHCRGCGNLFCDACSSWRIVFPLAFTEGKQDLDILPTPEQLLPKRVCKSCHEAINKMDGDATPKPYRKHSIVVAPRKVVIVAIGNNSEVFPYIALGKELKRRGHTVTIATDSSKQPIVEKNELEFYLIEGNLEDDLPGGGEIDHTPISAKNPLKLAPALLTQVKPVFNNWLDKFDQLINSNNYEFCVCNAVGILVGLSTLEKRTKFPFIVSWLVPCIPTKYYAPPILSGSAFSWFQLFNQVKWNYASSVSWGIYKSLLNEYRQSHDLLRYTNKTVIDILNEMKVPTMNNWSPALFSKPQDWATNVEITGALVLDPESENYQPPEELLAFLQESEDKPIFINFGTMMEGFPEILGMRILEICSQALIATHKRSVFLLNEFYQSKCKTIFQGHKDRVYIDSYIPNEWIMPRSSAAIISGEIGCTMCALRHGIVPLIIAFGSDQPFWGDLLHSKGLAPESKSVQNITLSHLILSIQEVFGNKKLSLRVKQIAARMHKENGNTHAADFVEKHFEYQPQWPSYLIPNV